jgi:Fungal Zn(2)-Cys(6) binuclear cluster domain
MNRGIQKERSKRHHNKTRTGCSTCKRRHFKCDEKKPSCLRCILAGKECAYNIPQPKTFPPPPQDSNLSPPSSVESFVGGDPSELRALQFFKERTGPSLH